MVSFSIPNNQVVREESPQDSAQAPESTSAVDRSFLDLLNLELTFKEDLTAERDGIRQTLGRVAALHRAIGTEFSEQLATSPESGRVLEAQGSARTGTIVQVPDAPAVPTSSHRA